MRRINKELGTTFIFSTHDQRVMEMSNRLVRIEDGVLWQLGVRSGKQWGTINLQRRGSETETEE